MPRLATVPRIAPAAIRVISDPDRRGLDGFQQALARREPAMVPMVAAFTSYLDTVVTVLGAEKHHS